MNIKKAGEYEFTASNERFLSYWFDIVIVKVK